MLLQNPDAGESIFLVRVGPTLHETVMYKNPQEAHPTSNSELTLVIGGTLASALGLVCMVLGAANWYFHRTSAPATDTQVASAFFFGAGLVLLAVIMFSLYGISRRTNWAVLRRKRLGGKTAVLQQHRASFFSSRAPKRVGMLGRVP